jgi:serine/threonine protein kinase
MPVINTALPFGTTLNRGKYRIEGVLGQGGFAITYKAVEVGRQEVLAIKELFPEDMAHRQHNGSVHVSSGDEAALADLIQHMRREHALLAQIKDDATTYTLDYWEENGSAYMAMEYLEGETLEARIARGALLTSDHALTILRTLLPLLHKVHLLGFLHRDIKPSNIIISKDGPELIDFGSATPFTFGQRIKVTSRFLTPAYAPLEQYGQEVMLGPATDLYALAATVYEALTGTRIPSALDRANGSTLIPLSTIRQDLDPLLIVALEMALELRIDQRPKSAEEMYLHANIQHSRFVVPLPPVRAQKNIASTAVQRFQPPAFIVTSALLVLIVFWTWFVATLILPRTNIDRAESTESSVSPQVSSQPTKPSPRVNPFFNNASCVRHKSAVQLKKADIYFLPLDDAAFEQLEAIRPMLEQQMKILISTLACASAPTNSFDPTRQQRIAEELTSQVVNVRQKYAGTFVLGVTSDDLFIRQFKWNWAFGMYEAETGNAILSSARMNPANAGLPKNQSLLEARLRKMVMKYVGLLYLKKPENTDNPKSVLYGSLSGVSDLDSREERF